MHAYRTPAVVDPEPLPNACVPGGAAPFSPWRHLTPAIVKALGVATTLFLTAGAATLGTITWRLAAAAEPEPIQARAPQAQAAAPAPLVQASHPTPASAPRAASPAFPPHGWDESALALSGPEGTNDVVELWSRAQRIQAECRSVHLSRATIPLRALVSGEIFDDIHVAHTAGPGAPGLRVTALLARSLASRAGLRRGDVIAGINGHALVTPDRLQEALEDVLHKRAALLEIARADGLAVVRVDLRP
jgi:hypothetical protein